MKSPYVFSNYKRLEDDNYKTIDVRCIFGLVEHFPNLGIVADPCSRDGSGIVGMLNGIGYTAFGWSDAFCESSTIANWIVTNPPYSRNLVDKIIDRQILRLASNEIEGLAILLRANFDFAKGRREMFSKPLYFGQIRLRFRPWWTESRKAQPIHNYVWHIWKRSSNEHPIVFYSDGDLK